MVLPIRFDPTNRSKVEIDTGGLAEQHAAAHAWPDRRVRGRRIAGAGDLVAAAAGRQARGGLAAVALGGLGACEFARRYQRGGAGAWHGWAAVRGPQGVGLGEATAPGAK